MATIKCVSAGEAGPSGIDFVHNANPGDWYRCVKSENDALRPGQYVFAGQRETQGEQRWAFIPEREYWKLRLLTLAYRVVPVELDEEQSQLVFREIR